MLRRREIRDAAIVANGKITPRIPVSSERHFRLGHSANTRCDGCPILPRGAPARPIFDIQYPERIRTFAIFPHSAALASSPSSSVFPPGKIDFLILDATDVRRQTAWIFVNYVNTIPGVRYFTAATWRDTRYGNVKSLIREILRTEIILLDAPRERTVSRYSWLILRLYVGKLYQKLKNPTTRWKHEELVLEIGYKSTLKIFRSTVRFLIYDVKKYDSCSLISIL